MSRAATDQRAARAESIVIELGAAALELPRSAVAELEHEGRLLCALVARQILDARERGQRWAPKAMASSPAVAFAQAIVAGWGYAMFTFAQLVAWAEDESFGNHERAEVRRTARAFLGDPAEADLDAQRLGMAAQGAELFEAVKKNRDGVWLWRVSELDCGDIGD